MIQMMLDAMKVLLKKHVVSGWPPVDKSPGWSNSSCHDDRAESDSDDKADDGHVRLEDRGVLELIITLMERWPNCVRVQEKGCFLLSRLWGPKDLRERCVLLVRNAMDRHLRVPELQGVACKAFKHFWFSNDNYLVSAEAIRAVCDAMENHPSSLRVQSAACKFFIVVLFPFPVESKSRSKVIEEIQKTEAMKLMLDAVTMHIGKKRFLRDAWRLITSLLRFVDCSTFFICGGVPAMHATLSYYESEWSCCLSQAVTRSVFQAFRWVCAHEDGAKHIDENVLHCVVSSLTMSSSIFLDSIIMKSCCKAIGHLAGDIRWAPWFAEKRIAEYIVKFMERLLDHGCHKRSHPELSASTFALTHLVQRESLQVDGALRAVLRAMAAIPKELKLQVQGCTFLASLHWRPLNAVKASAFRACDAVLTAMVMHAEEQAVQERGCLALATLLVHDANLVTTAKLNGVGILAQAMEKFPTNIVLQEQGRSIIRIMSKSTKARKHSTELRVVALLS